MTELPIRPRSVTITSWILMFWGASVLTLMVALEILNGMKLNADAPPAAALASVLLAMGIGLRRGWSWARTSWLLGGPLVIGFVTLHGLEFGTPALVVYLVGAIVLVRRRARLYFSRHATDESEVNHSPVE